MAKLEKIGYGQIEPNRLSAQKTKQIFAQLPLAEGVNICENGMVMVYDMEAGVARFPAEDEAGSVIGLVMNEIILEDDRYQEDKDYAMFNHPETQYQAAMTQCPRIFGLVVGDTFTTNALEVLSASALPAVGTAMSFNAEGYWVAVDEATSTKLPIAKVVKQTTMPDGQLAAKLQIVKV